MGPPRNRYAVHMSNKKKKAVNALKIESANPHQLTNGQQSVKEVMLGPDDCRMNFNIIISNRNPDTNNADEEGTNKDKMTASKKTRKSKRNKMNKKARKQADNAKIDDEDMKAGSVDQRDIKKSAMA